MVVAAFASVMLAAGAITATASDIEPIPDPPTWVGPGGKIDDSKLPSEIPVVGQDGEILKNASGEAITVDPRAGSEPDYDPAPRCPRCPEEPPPGPDIGDAHTTGTSEEGFVEEVVDVTHDTPVFLP
ncbi:hypothetical protein AB0D92_13750 [Streptomyces parvus]|uniref:hypothetical protein n=1 Tax=Streptomyces parvus TaxID=66428 RepID=UPI0033FDE52B